MRSLTAGTVLPLLPGYREMRWGELRGALLTEASSWRHDEALASVPRRQDVFAPVGDWPGDTVREGPVRTAAPDRPVVSVIMPAWNRAPVLSHAVASVRAQTFSDLELIVVDDGSTDDTAHVLRGICRFDPRVRVVRIDHAGVCVARNRGIEEARGEFIAFLDTDNAWEPDYLRRMITVMQAAEWDLAHAVLQVESYGGRYFRAFEGSREHLLVGNYIDLNVLVVRSTLLRDVGGFDPTLRRFVDYDLLLRLTLQSDLHLVPVIGAVYAEDQGDRQRISVNEPISWGGVVRARHLIDWDAAAAVDREPGRVTVSLPFRAGIDATVQWVEAVRHEGLNGRAVELCMVSSGSTRAHRLVAASFAYSLPSASVTATPGNVGFAVATDLALAKATGSTFVIARPNLEPMDGWLDPLLETLNESGVGAVQGLSQRVDGTVASAGGVFAGQTVVPEPLLCGFPLSDVLRIGESFRIPAALSGLVAVRTVDAVAFCGLDPLAGSSMTEVDLSLRLAEADRGVTKLDTRSRARERAPVQFGFPNDFGLAARVLGERWKSPPGGSRSLWESAGFIVHGHRQVELTSTSGNERFAVHVAVRRRSPPSVHEYPPRLRWAIDTAAPVGPLGQQWGDTYFAHSLAQALTDLGQEVAVDAREARWRDSRRFDDVVLVLRGLDRVEPSAGAIRLLWVISHPGSVDEREIRAFDRVYAASRRWAVSRAARWRVDVHPLLQCTDPALFNPDRAAPDSGAPVLFVGNSRRVDRPIVRYAVGTGADVWIYGRDWDGIIDAVHVKGEHVANPELGQLYASASIVLNDHWEDMRRDGFLSNRLFDAVACAARVVSDEVDGLGEVFGDSVRTFDSEHTLKTLLMSPRSNHFPDLDARRAIARRIQEEHSFARRAGELVDAAARIWIARQREPTLQRAGSDREGGPPPVPRSCDRPVSVSSGIRTFDVPLPPVEMRAGGIHFRDDKHFMAAAVRDVANLQRYAGLCPASRVLDWGCGSGRLAVGIKYVLGNVADYHGVDIQPALIAWAQQHLSDHATRFTLLNHGNERYNPCGESDYQLPVEPGSVDVVNAYSVFSHMLPDDVCGYARSIAETLAPDGRCLVTAFVEDGVADWEENPVGYGATEWTDRLHCVLYERRFFESMLAEAGLAVVAFVRGEETDGQSSYTLHARAQ